MVYTIMFQMSSLEIFVWELLSSLGNVIFYFSLRKKNLISIIDLIFNIQNLFRELDIKLNSKLGKNQFSIKKCYSKLSGRNIHGRTRINLLFGNPFFRDKINWLILDATTVCILLPKRLDEPLFSIKLYK